MKHDVEVKGKLDPIEIKHYIILDTKALYQAYLYDCEALFTVQADINKCADDKLNEFIARFTQQI